MDIEVLVSVIAVSELHWLIAENFPMKQKYHLTNRPLLGSKSQMNRNQACAQESATDHFVLLLFHVHIKQWHVTMVTNSFGLL